ncbi:MAG TPA: sugar phosphate isomerase/epimerase [Dehalococcoidia bacterium]|nr:sugar phosphate isomerase/epimerase [Dehalococcoidia bacterium]
MTSKTALSTMWATKRYEAGEIVRFAEAARGFGFDGIEINYAFPEEDVKALVDSGVPVLSMHAPAPLEQLSGGGRNHDLNLADTDEAQRREAVRHHKRTIDWAERAGAKYVVCHMGGIERDMFDEEKRLRKMYDSGDRDGDEVEALRLSAKERRAREVRPWFEQSRKSFLELVDYAAPKGIALGLENRYHFHEVPNVEETMEMLEEATTEQAGYWHDVGHAEVLGRIGLGEMYRWLNDLEHRTIGMHLHDVKGIGDHQAPGQGDADWDYIKTFIKPDTARTFEIGQHNSEEHVAASIPFLRELEIV